MTTAWSKLFFFVKFKKTYVNLFIKFSNLKYTKQNAYQFNHSVKMKLYININFNKIVLLKT